MTDSMIERIALAIYTDLNAQEDTGSIAQDCMQVARAVLKAMHEPTDQMVDAGFDTELDEDGDMAPRLIWSAMIDAALAEKG